MNDIQRIEAEQARLNQLEGLLLSNQGKHAKFLRTELHRLAGEVRARYRKIDMRGDHAALEVNTAQATESTYQSMIDWLSQTAADIQEQKIALDKELHSVVHGNLEVAEPGIIPTISNRGYE